MAMASAEARRSTGSTRWVQLVLGLIAMMSISSPQYVWTLFTKPLQETLGATLAGRTGHLHHSGRAANLAFAGAGLSGRPVRRAPADWSGLPAVRPGLDHCGLCDQPDRSLPDLRTVLRHRYRHRLCRDHRADGPMVSGSSRIRDRYGGGRLWLRRHSDHVPDRHHDEAVRLPAYAGGVRHHPWNCRSRRGACDAHADLGGCAAAAAGDGVAGGSDAGPDAAQQGVLADVLHDDDDVHRRLDDHLAVRGIFARLRRRQRHGARAGCAAAGAHHRSSDQRA